MVTVDKYHGGSMSAILRSCASPFIQTADYFWKNETARRAGILTGSIASALLIHLVTESRNKRAVLAHFSRCLQMCPTQKALDAAVANCFPYFPSIPTWAGIVVATFAVATAATVVVSKTNILRSAPKA